MTGVADLKRLFERIQAENDEPMPEPGLDPSFVATRLEEAGLPPHQLLVDVYSWHDGIGHLNAFLHFLPLDEAIEQYHNNRYRRGANWDPNWFPALTINGDVTIALDVASNKLLMDDVEDGSRWLIANHYQDYIDALSFVFDSGAAQFDPEGGAFEVDVGSPGTELEFAL